MTAVVAFGESLTGVRRLRPGWRTLVVVVILLDLTLVGAYLTHVVHVAADGATSSVFAQARWDGDRQSSWMELAQRLQLLVAILGCVVLRRRHGDAVYLVLATMLAVILLDDVTRLHEVGGSLFHRLGVAPVAGVTTQQLGELALWGVVGVVLATLLLLGYRRAGARARRVTLAAVVAMGSLVAFAMGVDTVGSMLHDTGGTALQVATVVENIGELLSIGLIAVVVLVEVARAAVLDRRDP